MYYIVSSCGTSLFTNLADKEEGNRLKHLSNESANSLTTEDREFIDTFSSRAKEKLGGADVDTLKSMSAEINGLISFYGGVIPPNKEDMFCFVHSDTYLGEACARLIADWSQASGMSTDMYRIPGLNTRDMLSFQSGMAELAGWCARELPNWTSYRIIFNLVGGFKSMNGFMQTLGMFYADESIYLFENSQLLRLPRLPLNLDEGTKQGITKNIRSFRKFECGEPVSLEEGKALPESMVFQIDDTYMLSPWGEVFWDKFKKECYGDELFPAPIDRIKYMSPFAKSLEGLSKERMAHINQRVDDLARYILSNHQLNSDRLNFKQIKGQVRASGLTHEFYAWSDSSADRVFCHMEGNVCCLDKLGDHL